MSQEHDLWRKARLQLHGPRAGGRVPAEGPGPFPGCV